MTNKAIGLIACLLLLAGCATARPKFKVNIIDRVDRHEAESIVDGVHVGFKTLLGCGYLQVAHPEAYAKLPALQDGLTVTFMDDKMVTEGGAYVCAAAFLNGDTVYLAPDIFDRDGCDVVKDIPHEMLHLIGLSHETSRADHEEFYNTFSRCVDRATGVEIKGLGETPTGLNKPTP